jgi:hypothetical protein
MHFADYVVFISHGTALAPFGRDTQAPQHKADNCYVVTYVCLSFSELVSAVLKTLCNCLSLTVVCAVVLRSLLRLIENCSCQTIDLLTPVRQSAFRRVVPAVLLNFELRAI